MVHESNPLGAMSEVSLAVAMAFFSVMILAMLSMGSGSSDATIADSVALPGTALNISGNPETPPPSLAKQHVADGQNFVAHDRIVLSDGVHFWSASLAPLPFATVSAKPSLVLVLADTLSLRQTASLRARLPQSDIDIRPMPANWQAAIERIKQ